MITHEVDVHRAQPFCHQTALPGDEEDADLHVRAAVWGKAGQRDEEEN